jgi:hypothetical protein
MQQEALRLAIEHRIISIPDLTEHKREFLRTHPEMLEERNARAVSFRYGQALAAGIPDDTQEMNEFLLTGVRQAREHGRKADAAMAMDAIASAHVMPRPEKTTEQVADCLDREASAAGAVIAATSALGVIDELAERVKTGEFRPPRKSSIPISAPVSREPPNASGERRTSTARVTLSAEERAIARNSFGPIKGPNGELVDMTPEAKEMLYAKNKARLAAMRQSGEYPERERN